MNSFKKRMIRLEKLLAFYLTYILRDLETRRNINYELKEELTPPLVMLTTHINPYSNVQN